MWRTRHYAVILLAGTGSESAQCKTAHWNG